MSYAELHCHSYYSFHDGASSLEELFLRAKDLGYLALALTDHDNLCGAMTFANLAQSLELHGIIGAELTLKKGQHLTLLAKDGNGYRNLCRLITAAHSTGERNTPELDAAVLPGQTRGLIALSGCSRGQLAMALDRSDLPGARGIAAWYQEQFGKGNYYLELQQNLVQGDTERIRKLLQLSKELDIPVVATGNVHYHVRERHRLQDCLVAVRHCRSLEETHRERRPNSEFYLRSPTEMEYLFRDCPDALHNTLVIAEQCTFDLRKDLNYIFPDYPVPMGYSTDTYLEKLCHEAAVRRYGSVTGRVINRLEQEFYLLRKYNLSGLLLMYHEVAKLGREVMIEQGLCDTDTPLEENPPGRGRGSSVALLVGYLIGISHIDPLEYNLSLERFLPADLMASTPDIDLDFPRSIREKLILRTHQKWGWDHAALTGTIVTYQIRGAVRDLGKALGLPEAEVDQCAKYVDYGSARKISTEMEKSPHLRDKINAPVWRDLVPLAVEMDGFPKYLGQHPGGMILSSKPLIDMVPIQRGGIEGRYICQWDKDSIDDAGFIKIDFLALGALSQLQDANELIKQKTGRRIDLSRIDFNDEAVYDMLCRGDTIGIFQVESAAQLQTITRLKPRNLTDMAHEVAAVRPGVGVNDGVRKYLARRSGREAVTYDHPLEQRALARTLGVVLFQDQFNQLAVDVAGFVPSEADRMRRAFGRKHNEELLEHNREKFIEGAQARGVSIATAEKIFGKINGQYMFPESHAFAFGVTAYQASWMKYYYPLEFFVAIFNQQPMGFYNLETLKEDAKRHGIMVLNPDVNQSRSKCTIDNGALRLGFLSVTGLGENYAEKIETGREKGNFKSVGDFLERTGVLEEIAFNLADAGAFDSLQPNRRKVKWEIGLRYRPMNSQLPLPFPVEQDMVALAASDPWESMIGEYDVLSLYPAGHIMASLRPRFGNNVSSSKDIMSLGDGTEVTTAGLVIRRQRPKGKMVFITLEDEFGHIPLMVFPQVYERNENSFKASFLMVEGMIQRREGTDNLVVTRVRPFNAMNKVPPSKNWC
jgi:error-prone DNA polymerase